MIRRACQNWLSRHRNPVSLALHAVGIPATVAGVVLVLAQPAYWLLAAGLFVGGYALQFLGHAIEGNRSGEELLLRRLLRRDPPGHPVDRQPDASTAPADDRSSHRR
jgi:uncharacterized membrane protein YGL010W